MLTTKDIEKAAELVAERERIASAKWNRICSKDGFYQPTDFERFDDKLAFTVEEYRARCLDAIDAELRELGVDPTTQSEPADEDDGVMSLSAR